MGSTRTQRPAQPDSAGRPRSTPQDPIFTALQEQLGLKLESKKGPLKTLIIDHMDRAPSEN